MNPQDLLGAIGQRISKIPADAEDFVRNKLFSSSTQTFNYRPSPAPNMEVAAAQPMPQAMAAAPSNGFKYQMGQEDYSSLRPQIESVLSSKQSPLTQYVDKFIEAGNKHKIDPRVLVTIANNESSMGKNYPTNSYNPFGYIWLDGKHPSNYEEIIQGLYGAGFTSMDHAIDALTGRFARQPTENYKKFYSDPTIENLQAAYNANPGEKDNYIKNGYDLAASFQ